MDKYMAYITQNTIKISNTITNKMHNIAQNFKTDMFQFLMNHPREKTSNMHKI